MIVGLDISAYGKLTKITPPDDISEDELGDWAYENGCVRIYVNPDFPGRADSLEHRAIYRHDGEVLGFRAGSYSGYNRWREALAALVGTTPEDVWRRHINPPFYELIDFSDCEGTIGPDAAGKLAANFAAYDDKAKTAWGEDSYLYHCYRNWRRAFEIAARGGAVCFH